MTTRVRSAASLVRQLGVTSATALVVSNMVGTGTFTAGNNDDILMVTLPNSAAAGDVKVLDATARSKNCPAKK